MSACVEASTPVCGSYLERGTQDEEEVYALLVVVHGTRETVPKGFPEENDVRFDEPSLL